LMLMLVRSIRFKGILVALCLLTAASLTGMAKPRGLPAREGILNFAQVSDRIFRGAQPDTTGLKNLQTLGVKTIIDLRMPDDAWKDEATAARTHGILYTNIPFRGFGPPTDAQMNQVLSLIESSPGPVFIHCQHGCDRTGTVIACYRIQHDRWSEDKAMQEARRHGLSWFERGMKKFVGQFGRPQKNAKAGPPDA
jgi:protein tyrosine phosphatase (PTP) superfamily phosphohydrolase (DUF442 family)